MRPRSALEKIKKLLKKPKFTSKEAQAYGVNAATIAYYIRAGEVVRIGRGIYRGAIAPTTEDFRWEDLIEAVQKTKGGVVCLTSALALYNMTEEIPRQFWIAIDHSTRHRASSSTKIIRMRNLDLGKTTLNVGGVSIAIFDRERTIIDSFKYLSKETAIKALKMALTKKGKEKLDFERLSQYSHQLRINIQPYILAVTT